MKKNENIIESPNLYPNSLCSRTVPIHVPVQADNVKTQTALHVQPEHIDLHEFEQSHVQELLEHVRDTTLRGSPKVTRKRKLQHCSKLPLVHCKNH